MCKELYPNALRGVPDGQRQRALLPVVVVVERPRIFFYANLVSRQRIKKRILANTSVRMLQGTAFNDSFELQGMPLGPPEEPEDCAFGSFVI